MENETTKIDILEQHSPRDPDDFDILVSSLKVDHIKVGVERHTGYGETFGPFIYYQGHSFKPDHARALIDVLTVALNEIDTRLHTAPAPDARADTAPELHGGYKIGDKVRHMLSGLTGTITDYSKDTCVVVKEDDTGHRDWWALRNCAHIEVGDDTPKL